MSFIQCVLELVANSLTAHAAAIAIRIHSERREIQVIDNGIGIQKVALERIAEYNATSVNTLQKPPYQTESDDHTLMNIRRLSDSFIITSRYLYSTDTFIKVYEVGNVPDLTQVERRPSQGTTVSIRGFHEIPLRKDWNISTICCLVAAIAAVELKVSFSIRDEERKKVTLRIANPHSPIDVLRTLFGKDLPLNNIWSIRCDTRKCNGNYHGYVGLTDRNAMQCVFLNRKPIACSLILNLIKIGFKESLDLPPNQKLNVRGLKDENIFVLLFFTLPRHEFAFITESGKRRVMFYDMQKLLTSVKNCMFRCLAKKTASCINTLYFRDIRLPKQTHLKSVRLAFNNRFSGRNKNITSSVTKKNKICMIGLKRTTITSSIVTNYSHKRRYMKSVGIKTINNCVEKRSESDVQVDQQSPTKYIESHENKITKKTSDDVDKTQVNCIDDRVITHKLDKSYNCRDYNDGKNENLANNISPLSEWSDWTSCANKEQNSTKNVRGEFSKNDVGHQWLLERTGQFNFLPRKLHDFLQCHNKLTTIKCLGNSDSTISFGRNWRQEEADIHLCNLKDRLCEFKLSRASLKCIKIINQINYEFIAAWMTYDGIKILLMIDQHAVHERIRYENLLLEYKAQKEGELLSVNLRNPLVVEFPTKTRDLLLRYKVLLKKYGISLGSSKENALLIRAIPKCLIANNDQCNGKKVLPRIYSLLNDILKNRDAANRTSALPLTIHNAIASEACHGAIKFGDELTVEQCTRLMRLLKCTKFPNRCAHGRPTIIPVMELSELEKRNTRIRKEKLNFASLRGQR